MTKLSPELVRRIPYTPRARRLRVARTERLSPSMRRIVLTGAELEPEFPFHRPAPADHVKVAFPDPATGELVIRRPGEGGGPAPILRDYTVRAVDHDARELTLDFVLHPHGPAGRWASGAAPGDEIGVLGPRGSRVFPDWCADYLIVADETGLPATERFLEELPREAVVRVVVLGSSVRELAGGRRAEITWLPAADEHAVIEAVAALPITGDTFTWAAGEASVIKALRRHLRDDRQADPAKTSVHGYWRIGTAGALPKDED